MSTPRLNPLRLITICTPAGVDDVRLEGGDVVGHWKAKLTLFSDLAQKRRLVEEFVNWPGDPPDVLRFTKRFGPLRAEVPGRPDCPAGIDWVKEYKGEALSVEERTFRFSVDAWLSDQRILRMFWEQQQSWHDDRQKRPAPDAAFQRGLITEQYRKEWTEHERGNFYSFETQKGESLRQSYRRLEFATNNLYRFLLLQVSLCPVERLRMCARQDCVNLYFIARHLGQRYCSEPCAQAAQSQWKLNWWASRGNQWREQQKPKRKKQLRVRKVSRRTPRGVGGKRTKAVQLAARRKRRREAN